MSSRRGVLASNSAASIVWAASASAVNTLLPLILVAILAPRLYAVWAVVFSLAGYISYFDVGVPASIQALVAKAVANDERWLARRAGLAGLQIGGAVTLLFLTCAVGVSLNLHALLPAMPRSMVGAAAAAFTLIAAGQCANLLINISAAYFVGLQRTFVPALTIAPLRIFALLLSVVTAATTQNLILTAASYCTPALAGFIVLLLRFHFDSATAHSNIRAGDLRKEYSPWGVLRYSGPLVLWSAAMLSSTGLGTFFVARFAYAQIVPFSIAQIVYTGIFGLMSAIGSPLLPELTRIATARPSQLGDSLVLATRVHNAILYLVAAAAIAITPVYLAIVTHGRVSSSTDWLPTILLIWTAAIHICSAPVSFGFVATGKHHAVILSPVMQAMTTVLLSLAWVSGFGAAGAASAMLCGSAIGTLITCLWHIPRTRIAVGKTASLTLWTLLVPPGALIFVTASVWYGETNRMPMDSTSLWIAIGLASGLAILWCAGLVVPTQERRRLVHVLRRGRALRD